MALGGAGGEIDLPVLGPGRGALVAAVEAMLVAAGGVDRVEERHPLGDGDLELPDAIAVLDPADLLTRGLGFSGFGTGRIDGVLEGDDSDRGGPRDADLDRVQRQDGRRRGGN